MKHRPLTEAQQEKLRQLYLAGMPLATICFTLTKGQARIKPYLDAWKAQGLIPEEQPHPLAGKAVEYEEEGQTIKRFPLGYAEGAFRQKVTAKPRATK